MKTVDLEELATGYMLLETTKDGVSSLHANKNDDRSENEKRVLTALEIFFNTTYFKAADKNDSDVLYSEFLKHSPVFNVQECGRLSDFFKKWAAEEPSPLVKHSAVCSQNGSTTKENGLPTENDVHHKPGIK